MAARLREGPDQINALGRVLGERIDPPPPPRVRAALDGIRPGLVADGGNLELVDVAEDGTVTIEMQGACRQCPAAGVTLRDVIEPRLRKQLPGITAVVAI